MLSAHSSYVLIQSVQSFHVHPKSVHSSQVHIPSVQSSNVYIPSVHLSDIPILSVHSSHVCIPRVHLLGTHTKYTSFRAHLTSVILPDEYEPTVVGVRLSDVHILIEHVSSVLM
jgi:hypothetical protein